MGVIYLQHPIHGAKVATMEAEANFDEQHGWERYTPHTPSASELDAPEEAALANELSTRRGRPRRAVMDQGE